VVLDAPGQLYNLQSDPGETRDLYDQQDLAQMVASAVEPGPQGMGVVGSALGAVSSAAGLRGSFDLSS